MSKAAYAHLQRLDPWAGPQNSQAQQDIYLLKMDMNNGPKLAVAIPLWGRNLRADTKP